MRKALYKLVCLGLLLSLLSGCATVADTAGSKEVFTACKAADVATTIAVLGKGGSEANPLMASVIKSWGYAGLIGVSVGLVWLVWEFYDSVPQPVRVGLNVVQCGVVAHNVGVLGSMHK